MSVLAHLAVAMGEPGATQALAYILNKQPSFVEALVKLLGVAGIEFEPRYRVESERGDDGGRAPGRPDMKIFDAQGNLRVLVENKFWAGLTDAQPVDYLRMLPEDVSSGLLFVVPTQRMDMVREALKMRCQDAGLDVGEEWRGEGRVKWMSAGTNARVLVTDWQNVLDTLEGAADGQEIRGDILQIRCLAKALEDWQAFPPLRSDEVTNADIPRRISNYIQLIVDICMQLQGAGMTYAANNSSFYEQNFYGYIKWDDGQGHSGDAYLTLSMPVWRETGGVTPLWLWMNRAVQLVVDEDSRGVIYRGDDKYMPIRLEFGVEREQVVENAVEQIRAAVFGG